MNPDEQETKKLLLVKVGMIVIIAVVLFLWLANLKGVFESQKSSNDKTWEKISEDMNTSLNRLDSISNNLSASSTDNSFVKDLLDKASSTATSTIATTTSLDIKKELTNIIKTATGSPKRASCPEYINCMPSIGEVRPCVIPIGCENITQIAY